MEIKKFSKNDSGFVCEWCGFVVDKLSYTSRDHCPNCLASKHVDINPGDRQNSCKGLMFPTFVSVLKDGFVVEYECEKCNEHHNNKSAVDDNFETILKVMNKTYNKLNFKQKNQN